MENTGGGRFFHHFSTVFFLGGTINYQLFMIFPIILWRKSIGRQSVDWTLIAHPMYWFCPCPMYWGKNGRTLDGRSVFSVTSF
jgi:hypothetical protein